MYVRREAGGFAAKQQHVVGAEGEISEKPIAKRGERNQSPARLPPPALEGRPVAVARQLEQAENRRTKQSGKAGDSGREDLPPSGVLHPDPILPQEAEAALGTERPEPIGADIPVDAAESGATAPSGFIRIGNREFSVTPRTLGSRTLDVLPDLPDIRDRIDIVGHFINIDHGRYVVGGRYASPTEPEMAETVARLSNPNANKGDGYAHLAIYAHGGLNRLSDEANRIATWKRRDIFGRNKIYNFHLMWGSGLIDEAFGPLSDTQAGRASSLLGDLFFETGLPKALGSAAGAT